MSTMGIRLVRAMKRAPSLSREQWRYLVVAVAELLIARVRLAVTDGGEIVRAHAHAGSPSGMEGQASGSPPLSIEALSWSLGAAGAHVPWRANCLVQAMAGHRWLRRHGIQADVVIGVDKSENGVFEAHAWLRHGDTVITGGPVDRFTPLIDPQRDEIRRICRR